MWKYLSRPHPSSSKAVEAVAHHPLLASESAHPLDVDVPDDGGGGGALDGGDDVRHHARPCMDDDDVPGGGDNNKPDGSPALCNLTCQNSDVCALDEKKNRAPLHARESISPPHVPDEGAGDDMMTQRPSVDSVVQPASCADFFLTPAQKKERARKQNAAEKSHNDTQDNTQQMAMPTNTTTNNTNNNNNATTTHTFFLTPAQKRARQKKEEEVRAAEREAAMEAARAAAAERAANAPAHPFFAPRAATNNNNNNNNNAAGAVASAPPPPAVSFMHVSQDTTPAPERFGKLWIGSDPPVAPNVDLQSCDEACFGAAGAARLREKISRMRSAETMSATKEPHIVLLDQNPAPSKHTAVPLPWPQRFAPQTGAQLVGNDAATRYLSKFLSSWQVRMALEDGTAARTADVKKKRKRRASACSDSDGSDSDFESPRGGCRRRRSCSSSSNAMNGCLLVGPVGSGKTAAVYALAEELGYVVREVNSGDKRSGQAILSLVREATQSHRATTGKPTLLLFEDVDVEEDKGFHAALRTIVESTRRPVILSANSSAAAEAWQSEVEVVGFEAVAEEDVELVVAAAAKEAGASLPAEVVKEVAAAARGDLRRALLEAQVVAAAAVGGGSGGGGGGGPVADAAAEPADAAAEPADAAAEPADAAAEPADAVAEPDTCLVQDALEASISGRHAFALLGAVDARLDRSSFLASIARAEAEAEAAAVVVGRAVRRCRRTASFPYLERQVGLDEALCVRLRDFSSKML
ncbi:AAA domain-containing protein [Pycnococcus provasolii]